MSTNGAIKNIRFSANNVVAMQTSRLSPVQHIQSCSPYQSFNLGLHVGDDENHVLANRTCLKKYFNDNTQIQWLEQVHGGHVIELVNYSEQPIVGDAIVTKQPDIALAIMTADCLPIFLVDKYGQEIAAIHGGWRPLAANIIDETLKKMETSVNQVEAWLGPCIGENAFVVGNEVKDTFSSLDETLAVCFKRELNNKWLANLPLIATLLLNKNGVKNIRVLDECTYQNEDKYYSYRRCNQTGRMASLIAIQNSV